MAALPGSRAKVAQLTFVFAWIPRPLLFAAIALARLELPLVEPNRTLLLAMDIAIRSFVRVESRLEILLVTLRLAMDLASLLLLSVKVAIEKVVASSIIVKRVDITPATKPRPTSTLSCPSTSGAVSS